MMEQIEIAVGTYENLILGYKIQEKVGGEFTLESSFTTDSHRGALRCLSMSPQGVLASSSTDDSIRLHSLKKRKEVGSLFQHDGSVNCIRFFKGGHMFTASEDGTICLWKCKSWELLRLLKGHRSHVMAVAVHPSAKLGLSVGSDRTFFTWDLTTGKLAFKRKTEQVAQDILFTNDGNNYILVYQKQIEVCSLEDTMVVQEMNFESRINSVCFVENNILAVGGDDGKLSIMNVISGTQLLQETFKGRLKSMCVLPTKMDILLFLTSSNGTIRVCRLDFTEGSEKLETVVVFESGVRITCMTAYAPPEILKEVPRTEQLRDKRRRKRKAYDEGNDEDEIHEKEDSNGNDEEDDGNDEEDDGNDEEDDGNEEEDDGKESDDEILENDNGNGVENADEILEGEDEDFSDEDSDSEEASMKEPPKKKQKNTPKKKKKPLQSSDKLKSQKAEKSGKKVKKSKSEDAHPKKKRKIT